MAIQGSPFVWYELMTTDPEAAETFYRNVVGWSGQVFDMGAFPYTILSASDRTVAGMMKLPQEAAAAGAPPAWMGYIGTPDVDAATGKVVTGGGRVHRQPDDIPTVGRFSVVADPQGAVFTLFTPLPGTEEPSVPPMTAGHGAWHELMATDWPSAFDFYAAQFGWTKGETMDMGEMGTYQLFASGGDPLGGMMNKPPEAPVPFWLFYFSVPALDPAIAQVTKGGGQVIFGPMSVPGDAWVVQCVDPQGAAFALVSTQR